MKKASIRSRKFNFQQNVLKSIFVQVLRKSSKKLSFIFLQLQKTCSHKSFHSIVKITFADEKSLQLLICYSRDVEKIAMIKTPLHRRHSDNFQQWQREILIYYNSELEAISKHEIKLERKSLS